MDSENRNDLIRQRRRALLRTGLLLLVLLLAAAIPVTAWLTGQRKLAAAATIYDPISIELYAGAGEDHRYINLNAIDVSKGTLVPGEAGKKYMDFVFGIKSTTRAYKMQLAHTTNNPYEYEVYYASESGTSSGDVPYTTHDAVPVNCYYNREAQIPGTYQNQSAAYTATSSGTWHDKTYGSSETRVQTHAEPLYWQSTNSVYWGGSAAAAEAFDSDVIQYFILRVKWPAGFTTNTRETDILYISAEVVSSDG